MTLQRAGLRLILAAALAAGLIAALTVAPAGAQSPSAHAADKAGDAYTTAVAKAKEKRAAKLKRCQAKQTKAARKACKKAAQAAFKKAKAKAKKARDKARKDAQSTPKDDGPTSPGEARQEYQDCLHSDTDRRICQQQYREDRKGGRRP